MCRITIAWRSVRSLGLIRSCNRSRRSSFILHFRVSWAGRICTNSHIQCSAPLSYVLILFIFKKQ